MRFKSFSKELKGSVLEILGTAFSVGCQVDGRSPKAVGDDIKDGTIESTSSLPRDRCRTLLTGAQFLTNEGSEQKA